MPDASGVVHVVGTPEGLAMGDPIYVLKKKGKTQIEALSCTAVCEGGRERTYLMTFNAFDETW